MADIRAAQSGNFNTTTTWVGGVIPGAGDVAYSNTFTITVNTTRTVQAISNAAGTSITVGGTFSVQGGCNLTCTNANGVVQGNTNTSVVTTANLTLGNSATINAVITNNTTTSFAPAVSFSSAGTLNINGNCTGSGNQNGSDAVNISGTGTLNIVGNVAGPSTSSVTSCGLNITGGATVNVTGNVLGGGGSSFTTPNAPLGILLNNGNAIVSVTGNVSPTGGTPGIYNVSGTLTVNGTCQSSSTSPAIGVGGVGQITRLSGPFLLGASGNVNPVIAASWRWAPTQIPTYYEVSTSGGTTKRNMFTADNIPTGNYPTAANVRNGIVYGPNLENTGTLAVPAAGSVALGVSVDNTVGTAVLTSAAVQTALGQFSSGRLNNVATVDTTGAQIQAAVTN